MSWKPVNGYEGLYEVSDSGEVRSCDRYIKTDIRHVKSRLIKGRILYQNPKSTGYKTVDLCKDGKVKTTLVHRLVAEAFLPNPDGLRFVNHKDSNRANNAVRNLEWVKETYPDRINGTMRVAAHNIASACKGRTPKAYGFTWIYHEGSTTILKGSRGKRSEMGDPSNIEGEDIV